MQVNPYLSYKGQCETAFKFYEKCLAGKVTAKVTYGETPMADQMPSEWRTKIIHSAMKVGEMVLMGGDPPPDKYIEPKGFSLTISVDDPAEAERIFQALVENGAVNMPLQQTFWADRFGMLTDQFGIPWMIMCRKSA
jgi:PhnB protein